MKIKVLLTLLVIPILGIDSCKDEIENEDGPVVASSVVLEDICYRYEPKQIQSLKVGEYSLASKSMSVLSGASTVVEQHYLEVLGKEEKLCETQGDQNIPCDEVMYSEFVYDIENDETSAFERFLYVPVVEEAILSRSESTLESSIDQDICYLTEDLYKQAGIKMTYHNFSKNTVIKKLPKLVRDREDCGDCKINVKVIRFDQVLISSAQRYRRRYTYELSSEVPYLSRILKRCITHSIPQHFDDNENGRVDEGEVRVVSVHECREITDFRFGT